MLLSLEVSHSVVRFDIIILFSSPSPDGRQVVAVAASRGVEVDEPDVRALEHAAPEVPGVQGDDLLVIVVDAEVVIVVIPGLIILFPVPLMRVVSVVSIEIILLPGLLIF